LFTISDSALLKQSKSILDNPLSQPRTSTVHVHDAIQQPMLLPEMFEFVGGFRHVGLSDQKRRKD
jgi:hypothetical protein